MRQIFLILIVLLCLGFISCKKDYELSSKNGFSSDDSHSHDTFLLNPDCYPYLFDVGSYWIYQNNDSVSGSDTNVTNTNRIDSVVVKNITKYFRTENGGGGFGSAPFKNSYEQYSITYYSSYLNAEYTEHLKNVSIAKYGGWMYEDVLLCISCPEGNAKIIFDTLVIENNPYYNVSKNKVSENQYITGNYYLYYTPNIGLVKKEILENDLVIRTWNLKSYNVSLLPNP